MVGFRVHHSTPDMDFNISCPECVNVTAPLLDGRNYTFSSYYLHSPLVATIFILAYLFIFFLCMVGNLLVCLIVLKNKQMRTVTNIFIFNLAISDLLVGLFCLPITLADNLITGENFTLDPGLEKTGGPASFQPTKQPSTALKIPGGPSPFQRGMRDLKNTAAE